MINKAPLLLETLNSLTFETYIELADSLTELNKFNVEKALEKQATLYSYYSALEAEAKRQESLLKGELEEYEAERLVKFRNENKSSIKKPTAKDSAAFVISDPTYSKLRKNLVEATYKRDLLKGLLEALEQRKDMAVQLAARVREEMKLT